MRRVTHAARVCSAAALVVLVIGIAAGAAKAATMFPSVSGRNLSGRTVQLPDDFKAPASVVFVAYVRGQQTQVDSWKPFVTDVRARFPAIGVYEVPTLSKSDALLRWFIDGGMRRGIPDAATRDVTITLYIDKGPFDAALGITSEAEITILLVRPNGAVVYRSTGSYTPAKAAGFADALSELGARDGAAGTER